MADLCALAPCKVLCGEQAASWAWTLFCLDSLFGAISHGPNEGLRVFFVDRYHLPPAMEVPSSTKDDVGLKGAPDAATKQLGAGAVATAPNYQSGWGGGATEVSLGSFFELLLA